MTESERTANPRTEVDDATSRRRWRFFVAIEAVLTIVFVTALRGHLGRSIGAELATAILGPWLVITLPICALYLIGKAPIISGEPLWSSAEARALEREIRARPALSDEEFYSRYYERSGIPLLVVARIRRRLLCDIDKLSDRAIPGDSLATLWDELDFADLLDVMGREFGVQFTEADYPNIDGTLDNLIRVVHQRVLERPREGEGHMNPLSVR